MRRTFYRHAVHLGILAGLAGCAAGDQAGDGLDHRPVSGTVTLDGVPLAEGSIQFIPVDAAQATSASGTIKDGAFSIEAVRGPVPGEYKVAISSSGSSDGIDTTLPPGEAPRKPAADLIPATYNTKTTLRETVKADAENAFTFELQKK